MLTLAVIVVASACSGGSEATTKLNPVAKIRAEFESAPTAEEAEEFVLGCMWERGFRLEASELGSRHFSSQSLYESYDAALNGENRYLAEVLPPVDFASLVADVQQGLLPGEYGCMELEDVWRFGPATRAISEIELPEVPDLRADSRVVAAYDTWRECMKSAGVGVFLEDEFTVLELRRAFADSPDTNRDPEDMAPDPESILPLPTTPPGLTVQLLDDAEAACSPDLEAEVAVIVGEFLGEG